MILRFIFCAVIAYLLGSISSGILLTKNSGHDIRREGSGNTGASNALRVFGVRTGLATFICDVLKAAHHGSNDAGSFAFLESASPAFTVISCGKDNEHGHPHGRLLGMLEDLDTTLFRTDLSGTILITSDGAGVKAYPEREAEYKELWEAGVFPGEGTSDAADG